MLNKFFLLLLFFSFQVFAQTVKVGLEPFPPIINQDGTGIAVELLDSIASKSDLTFDIHLMTYARAKKELVKGDLDLIGISPKGLETQIFYHNAEELDWSFNTTLDIFSKSETNLITNNIEDGSIGTLIGNADFISEVTSLPIEKFVEVTSLDQLGIMLNKKRLKAVIFERVAMINTINRLGLPNIYYQKIRSIPASFAVRKTKEGIKLKQQLDELLKQINTRAYLIPYDNYNQLSNFGIVSTFSDKKKR